MPWPPRSPELHPIRFGVWGSAKTVDAKQRLPPCEQNAAKEIRHTWGVRTRLVSVLRCSDAGVNFRGGYF